MKKYLHENSFFDPTFALLNPKHKGLDPVLEKMLHFLLGAETCERVYVFFLDAEFKLIDIDFHDFGDSSSTPLHIETIYSSCESLGGKYLIVAHNHPGGSLYPSKEDIRFTSDMIETSRSCSIKILDSFIVTAKEVVSIFDEEGFYYERESKQGEESFSDISSHIDHGLTVRDTVDNLVFSKKISPLKYEKIKDLEAFLQGKILTEYLLEFREYVIQQNSISTSSQYILISNFDNGAFEKSHLITSCEDHKNPYICEQVIGKIIQHTGRSLFTLVITSVDPESVAVKNTIKRINDIFEGNGYVSPHIYILYQENLYKEKEGGFTLAQLLLS